MVKRYGRKSGKRWGAKIRRDTRKRERRSSPFRVPKRLILYDHIFVYQGPQEERHWLDRKA